jgi:hypothetical protein
MPLDETLKYFAGYIENEVGIVYAEHNFFQLQNRLTEIGRLLGVESPELLMAQARQVGISGQFKQLLLDLATTTKLRFSGTPRSSRRSRRCSRTSFRLSEISSRSGPPPALPDKRRSRSPCS